MKTNSTYDESINFLNNHINFEAFAKPKQSTYKLDLSHLLKYIEGLGLNRDLPPIIHIAGTKGKGTIAMLIEKALRISGKKTGLFTSPHLYQVNERIRLNGLPLSNQQFAEMIDLFKVKTEPLDLPPLSYFEILTIAFILYIKQLPLDFILLETGLGGRLDSTNIFQTSLSIISKIDFDHTHILGNTLTLIAAEKAGILKKNVPAICLYQESSINEVFKTEAKSKGTLIEWARIYSTTTQLNDFEKENFNIIEKSLVHLTKTHQVEFPANTLSLLQQTTLPGRFEKFKRDENQKQTIILDVSHNQISFQFLHQKIKTHFQDKPISIILALSNDKSPESLKPIIDQINCKLYLLPVPNNPRVMPTKELKRSFPKGIQLPTFKEGLEIILKENDTIPLIFTGSFYLTGEVGKYFNRSACY